jgi:CheY-like chemotaxis protein
MGIMGNAQLAFIYCDDENTKTKLENIYEFSERGKDITNNLISFSKDQEPKQTYFKIENKIELVLNMLEKDLADIEVSRNYQKGIPELLADPGMIQDVLTNLIQNSVHAMSRIKNPALALKAYSQDDMVYFEIEDNGCGIPKEHQRSIFTPSFTLKGSHDKTGSYKSGIKGTGYGLSNVKKYIVEKHKGDIFLESEVGKGTKITIALKIIKKRLSPDEQREVAKSQIYGKRRILLVEDEPAIAEVQYQILTKDPFRHIVSLAVNGQTAVDIFDRNEFDVVSLDYMLPGDINGLDVYYHIRENDKDIPVVFISGNIEFIASMNQLKEKDPHLDHLPKPVNNLEYVNKINELIGRRTYKHGGSF